MQKVLNAIQRVGFPKSTLRHASIRDRKGPSLGKTQVKPQHQRSTYAVKFEDRSHEETERQERCAQSKARDFAKTFFCILLAYRKVGSPKRFSKRAGGERVCV